MVGRTQRQMGRSGLAESVESSLDAEQVGALVEQTLESALRLGGVRLVVEREQHDMGQHVDSWAGDGMRAA